MRLWVTKIATTLLWGAAVVALPSAAQGESPRRATAGGPVAPVSGSKTVDEAIPRAVAVTEAPTPGPPVPAEKQEHSLAAASLGCSGWLDRSRSLEEEGRLLDARESLAHCDLPTCAENVRRQCDVKRREVEQRIPRLVLRVKTVDGEHIGKVRAYVDGNPVQPDTLVDVDPGDHSVRTHHDDYVGRLSQVHLGVGERRTLVVRLRAREDVPDERLTAARFSNWSRPEAAWALVGASVGAFASAIVMDAYTAQRVENLKQCSPNCDEALVDSVERDIQLTKLAAGLGVLSLATAAWIALAEEPQDVVTKVSYAPRLRVTGGPSRATATLTARFDEAFALRLVTPRVAPRPKATGAVPQEFHPRKAPTPVVPRAPEVSTCRKGCSTPQPEALDARQEPP